MKHVLTFALLFSGVAHAQTASTETFGPRPAAPVHAEAGVRRSVQSEFALIELGDWRPPPAPPQSPPPDDPSLLVIEEQAAPSSVADPCGGRADPPPLRSASSATARRRERYWPIVRDLECRYRLPAGLLDALLVQESRYVAHAVSPAGARGLGQLMPGTARELGVADIFDPAENLDGAARYLAKQLTSFGSPQLALAAYNAGPHRVARLGRIPRIPETVDYVRKVMSHWADTSGQASSATELAQVLGFLR